MALICADWKEAYAQGALRSFEDMQESEDYLVGPVPQNTMSLLFPPDLTENDQPDVALVVELMESGAYIGQTILTMKMAYNNARLFCRPDSD